MEQDKFKALVLDKKDEEILISIQELKQDMLPAGDLLISVAYSDLNYKDGLALTGQGKVVRKYPMVPGIDLAGTVVESMSPAFKVGEQVVVTGCGMGETHWGGYAQLARVDPNWATPLPEKISLKQAMAIGTAGVTAMMSVMALEERGLKPDQGQVVVTGASGGVGSLAIAILAQSGYQVVASTGRTETHAYLHRLGAQKIIDRTVLAKPPDRPLESGRWAGAIDVVGGETLASLLTSMAPNGSVAACGLAGGSSLHTTVFPFILRGVSLIGINAANLPREQRLKIWGRLEQIMPGELLDRAMQVVPLADLPALAQEILAGHIRGRTVIDLNA